MATLLGLLACMYSLSKKQTITAYSHITCIKILIQKKKKIYIYIYILHENHEAHLPEKRQASMLYKVIHWTGHMHSILAGSILHYALHIIEKCDQALLLIIVIIM